MRPVPLYTIVSPMMLNPTNRIPLILVPSCYIPMFAPKCVISFLLNHGNLWGVFHMNDGWDYTPLAYIIPIVVAVSCCYPNIQLYPIYIYITSHPIASH